MKKIRTALVGLGRIAWEFHLPQLTTHPGYELSAVVDPVKERLDEAVGKWGECLKYESLELMLDEVKPDLVVIASPTIFHEAQIIASFRAGADVFAEKPLTATLDECDRVLAAAKELNRNLMVYQPRRLDKDCSQAREIIKSGKLGKIHQLKRNVRGFARRNDWQALSCYAGGMLNNYGVHYIDQVCFALGNFEFKCEYCDLRCINTLGDAEDFVKVILRENDLTVEVEISQSCAFPTNEWFIEGDLGTAKYSSLTRTWEIRYTEPGKLAQRTMQKTLAADGRRYPGDRVDWQTDFEFTDSETAGFYDNLAASFYCGNEPLVKTAESRQVLLLLDNARKISDRGQDN